MKKPFVSIVVASYNRKYIINESIQSILSQNYPEDSFEVIVVDNNSNDGTVSVSYTHLTLPTTNSV